MNIVIMSFLIVAITDFSRTHILTSLTISRFEDCTEVQAFVFVEINQLKKKEKKEKVNGAFL